MDATNVTTESPNNPSGVGSATAICTCLVSLLSELIVYSSLLNFVLICLGINTFSVLYTRYSHVSSKKMGIKMPTDHSR